MIKKTITYETFDGETVTEDHYFNLNKSELIAMEHNGGTPLSDKMYNIVDQKSSPLLVNFTKHLIRSSYGVKSEDGKRFIKTPELTEEFMNSLAFDELYVSLLEDENVFSEFLLGVLPKSIAENIDINISDGEAAIEKFRELKKSSAE